jgi:hypothetical protein
MSVAVLTPVAQIALSVGSLEVNEPDPALATGAKMAHAIAMVISVFMFFV